MPCFWTKLADGTLVHVNMAKTRAKRCFYCPTASVVLCDAPSGADDGETCDRPCCRAHAKKVGPDRDLCRDHALAAAKFERQREATQARLREIPAELHNLPHNRKL